MKYKSKQTTIFSILALIFIVLGVIFTLLFNNKLPMFHNLVVQSEKVDVTIVDGYPILSGKIKNISNEDVVLKENCLTINIWSDYWGEVYLQLHTDDKIILAKGQELDLSSSRIYVEYIFVYSVGELFTKMKSLISEAIIIFITLMHPVIIFMTNLLIGMRRYLRLLRQSWYRYLQF